MNSVLQLENAAKAVDVGFQFLGHRHPAHVGDDRRDIAVLQAGEQLDCGVFHDQRHRADAGHMFELFVLVHLGANVLGF